MFSFSSNFLNDDKGVEGAKILKFPSTFNNKNRDTKFTQFYKLQSSGVKCGNNV